jgi:peptide/nickel transport system substrate-binding protein
MRIITSGLSAILLLAVVGCASSSPSSRMRPENFDGQAGAAGPKKTLVIGQINAVRAYGPWDFSNTAGGGSALLELHTVSLKTAGRNGGLEPRIAQRIPSFDDGSIMILPDGRMSVTWKLRPDVRWQDGVPLTAEDLVFSWQLASRRDFITSSGGRAISQVENVEIVDSITVVMTWPVTYYRALDMGPSTLWLFPKHLLGEALETLDREAFLAQPFFTTEYVSTGPFRIVDWGLGENQVLEAFDQYFLGRPRIDRIILRSISDVNIMLTNLKARAINMTTEKTLPLSTFVDLRQEWQQSGEGVVVSRQENWRYVWFQFHPEFARPVELSQNVHLRRGLHHSLDRAGLRELLLPGVEHTNADTFMLESDPRKAVVGEPYARYVYDPRRALQEFEEGGWRRASDGRLLDRAGQQVQLEVRGQEPDTAELAFEAAGWRQIGIDMTEYIPPSALNRDSEFKSKFPAMEATAKGSGEDIWDRFDGRLGSGPENRWQGGNNSHYASPAFDRLLDRLTATIDDREQALVLREIGEVAATDLPAMATFFRTAMAAVGKGVRALDDYATGATGTLARNAHLWEITG